MKKDLRSMAAKKAAQTQSGPGSKDIPPEQMRQFSQTAEKYQGMSEQQLMNELMKQKANGAVTPEALDRLASVAGPMLDDQQKKKLRELMRMMKK
jgi:hypothetical protein